MHELKVRNADARAAPTQQDDVGDRLPRCSALLHPAPRTPHTPQRTLSHNRTHITMFKVPLLCDSSVRAC